MREPGIEPGPTPWQGAILPLDHSRCGPLSYGPLSSVAEHRSRKPGVESSILSVALLLCLLVHCSQWRATVFIGRFPPCPPYNVPPLQLLRRALKVAALRREPPYKYYICRADAKCKVWHHKVPTAGSGPDSAFSTRTHDPRSQFWILEKSIPNSSR